MPQDMLGSLHQHKNTPLLLMVKHWNIKTITYISGLFQGGQFNWAALTKEAYAVYMMVKKLYFYLADAIIMLQNGHLPLK